MRKGKQRAIEIALLAGATAAGYAQTETGEPDRGDFIHLYDDAAADIIPLSE